MKEKFIELFGEYSNEYILENYAMIFDMPENEVDQGLLAMLTMESVVEEPSKSRAFSLDLGTEYIVPPDDDYPVYVEAEPEQVEPVVVTEDMGISANEAEIETSVSAETETFASIQTTAALINQASNGFTSISLVSATSTSVVLDIWYKSNSVNNQLKKYDSYAQSWTYLFGNGQPAATSQRITITGLNPGAIYKFNATTYDFETPGWKDSIITIQTTGFKTPSFTIQGTTASSITVKATFPSEFQWGNRIRYYNSATATWENATSSVDCYVKSGTYTIGNLISGINYSIAFSYYDGVTEVWSTQTIKAATQLPPENLQTYTYSNMVFQLDAPLVNLLTTAKTNRMMANINNGYTLMHNLVGGAKPYNGDKMIFKTDRVILTTAEAQSGQPILWKLSYAMERALEMNSLNADNTHAPIHEVAHNFDSYKWNFEPEVFAYIKTYYYFATTNQTLAAHGQMFIGQSGYKNFMKSVATDSGGGMNYDGAIPYGNYSHYGLAYNLSNIADATGWAAFTKTFEYFHALPYEHVPNTNIGKFNLFMTKLKDYSGVDVLAMFTAQEKSIYGAKLGGTINYTLSTNNTSLNWPTDSGEVTLWYGQIDELYSVIHQSIDIQGSIGETIRAIGDGVVVYKDVHPYYGNALYVNFKLNGENMQVRYANLTNLPNYSIGQSITEGATIGTMKELCYGKGLVEITILKSTNGLVCATDNTNTVAVDPMLYLEKPRCDESYLEHPMATTVDLTGVSSSQIMPMIIWPWEDKNNPNIRYRENLDLEKGENYLRKIVLEYAVKFDRKAKNDNLEAKGILTYSSSTGIATIKLNGRTVKYGVSQGNAVIKLHAGSSCTTMNENGLALQQCAIL